MYLDTTVDLEYIARLSAREDLRIMLATPATVLGLRRQD
jgi:lipopolysaccharide/colanic/teichoic acid biosynthesis glycosyltransferase